MGRRVHGSQHTAQAVVITPVRRVDGSVDVEATVKEVDRASWSGAWRLVTWLPGFRRVRAAQAEFVRSVYSPGQPLTE